VIRLLHLADLHLGRAFQMLGEKGAAQRRALDEDFTVMPVAPRAP